jgi:DNA-directed RNA polymerase specialized sigma24 family protein
MRDTSTQPETGGNGLFPPTHWSVIIPAGDTGSPLHQRALNDFCQSYRAPVYHFFLGHGCKPPEAEDLTQEFFTRLLEKELLAGLTRKGTRFRFYLLTVLRNFQINAWRAANAQKRGGGAPHISIDADTGTSALPPIAVGPPPEALFDREWAKAVVASAMRRLREHYEASGQEELFEALQGCFFGTPEKLSAPAAAKALKMTVEAVRTASSRMRKRYRELLRTEVAAHGTPKAEIEEEIRYLKTVLEQG